MARLTTRAPTSRTEGALVRRRPTSRRRCDSSSPRRAWMNTHAGVELTAHHPGAFRRPKWSGLPRPRMCHRRGSGTMRVGRVTSSSSWSQVPRRVLRASGARSIALARLRNRPGRDSAGWQGGRWWRRWNHLARQTRLTSMMVTHGVAHATRNTRWLTLDMPDLIRDVRACVVGRSVDGRACLAVDVGGRVSGHPGRGGSDSSWGRSR